MRSLFCFMLFVLPMSTFGQEICNNGIDDDGDGLTDWKDTTDCPCGLEGTSWENTAIYYVPNAFSPDGDEHNNEFTPVFTCGFSVLEYELIVYDRRGQIIFTSRDHTNGWDGTSMGVRVQNGVFSWTISYRSSHTDEVHLLKGHVALVD